MLPNAQTDAETEANPLLQPAPAPEVTAQVERSHSPPAPVAASAAGVAPAPPPTKHEARRVLRAALADWLQPGLCGGSAEAARVRERVSSSFRFADLGEKGRLYLDPRLPPDSERPVLDFLNQAEHEVGVRLGLRPARPLVFVYADQPLMKASACINEDVVAFYDGALHVVVNRTDLLASVLHEYAHHALFSAGLMGPAWAQEGIAMNIAKESWWREGRRLQALLDSPFALDEMDRAIAYKLKPEQAVAFYVQSAALVECVLRERHWSLRQLFATLSGGSRSDSVTYDIPELARRTFLSDCIAHGLNGAAHE